MGDRGYQQTIFDKDSVAVNISAAWLNHRFNCNVEYILETCHGRCCEGTGRIMVSLCQDEEAWHIAQGQRVEGGLLKPRRGKCPYKATVGLCALHGTPNKPFGCIASPFTLNVHDTLIIRQRYSRLRCHGTGPPAYESFKASLDLLFGKAEARRIAVMMRKGSGNFTALMRGMEYNKLKYLDSLKPRGKVK